MSRIRTLLARTGLAERRKNQRMDAHGLTASLSAGSEPRKVKIGNISPTGLYLITEDRWPTGTHVLLTLGEKSKFDKFSRSQVNLWTQCIRVDQNGVGLGFTHAHTDPVKWLEAMSKAPSSIAENHLVHVFRYTRALAFLLHISPASEGDLLKLITKSLTPERTERAIEIALLADDLLEAQSGASRTDIPSSLVLLMLEMAMEVEEPEMREYWAQLLASSSLHGSQDDLSLSFACLLSGLDLFHLRILSAAWRRARQAQISSEGFFCTVEEAAETAGLSGERIESIVNDLHALSLLGNTAKPALCDRLTQINLALTDRGLKLCAHCCGQPQPVQSHDTSLPERYEQYVPLDSEEVFPASVREGLLDSLASQAETLRQNSSVAVLD